MENRRMKNFGQIMVAALTAVNVLHLLWTIWLIKEQIETGWGYGTNMELAVLFPWLTELICAPEMIAGIVYMVLCLFKAHEKKHLVAVASLFAAAAVQFVLTNLFIWF